MGRHLCSRFDRLFPNMERHALKQQAKQACYHDNIKHLHAFSVGDQVYAKDFSSDDITWAPGTVNVTGPLSYHVQLCDGHAVCRHVDVICDPVQHIPTSSTENLYQPDTPRRDTKPPAPPPPPPPLGDPLGIALHLFVLGTLLTLAILEGGGVVA